jgi:flagellum-specific ATP synthase
MAAYRESEDLINVGAYVKGTNPKVDKAIAVYEDIIGLLRQDASESSSIDDLFDRMVELARKAERLTNPNFSEEEN